MQKYWEDLVWEHVVRAFGMGVPHGSLMNKKTTTFSVDKILHFEPYNILKSINNASLNLSKQSSSQSRYIFH